MRHRFGAFLLSAAVVLACLAQACLNPPTDDFAEQCQRGDLETVSARLKQKPSLVEATSRKNGASALYLAAANGHADVVKLLLAHGATLERRSEFGTALHVAAESEFEAVVEVLLRAGASVKAQDNWGNTPLHVAAVTNERAKVLHLLLAAGAAPNAANARGQTPLHRAKHESVVKLLLARGSSVGARDHDGRTALHVMAQPREIYEIPIAKALVQAGCPLDAVDNAGDTALDTARRSKKSDLASFLETAGKGR